MKKSIKSRYHAIKKQLGIKKTTLDISHQKRIVIYLHQNQPLNASWVILSNHSEIQQTVLHGDLSAIGPIANQYEIHVIIPGQDVLLTQAELPKLSRERLLQALPYAVEDKLADEINHLHFAIGKYSTHGTSVAIISKDKMDDYLEQLSQFGIAPHSIIPAPLALPWIEQHWHVACDDVMANVRTQLLSGFACERDNLQTLLQLHILDLPIKPDSIHIDNTSTKPIELNLAPILINETVLSENHFLEKTALLLGANSYINLLQGAYRPKRKATQTRRIWLFAGILAVSWFVLSIFSNIISYFILQQAKKHSEVAIHQIYHQQFPTATTVVAPRERMESALKKAATANDKNNFLMMLAYISTVITKLPDIHLLKLNYQNERFNLIISAKNSNALDRFILALNKKGLTAKQQNATINNDTVKADILITKGDL